MTSPRSVTPAFSEPPHLLHPTGAMAVWFTEPAGMVTQLVRPNRGTTDLACFMAQLAFAALLELRGRRVEQLTFVHDLTLLTGYDEEAKRIWTTWALEIRDRIARIVIVQPRAPETLASLEVTATALVPRGVPFETRESVEQAVADFGLMPQLRARLRQRKITEREGRKKSSP
ncbi:MAG TPA: hypothetical protein VKZ49_18990 [Polyangiaceae bacterium]|nr:hypothetical protein [Polyangiaceae bacterium]